jgi:hypothetical protein
MSLLEQFRSISVNTAAVLTSVNVCLITGAYTFENLYHRAIALTVVAGFSLLNLKLLFHAQRIDPIVSLYEEWTDSETLMALTQKANVNFASIKQPTINVQDLVLDHYLFLGINAIDYAKKLINYFGSSDPTIKLLDLNSEQHRLQLTGIKSERMHGGLDKSPRIILTNQPMNMGEAQELLKMNLYYFVLSQTDQPIRKKVVDHDNAKTIDPFTKVTCGYYDGTTLYQLAMI